MYLAKIDIDIRKPEAAMALTNPEIIHKSLSNCIGAATGERGKILWRIDKSQKTAKRTLLIQTNTEVGFSRAVETLGKSSTGYQQKRVYDTMNAGETFQFCFKGNPVVTKNGHKIPLNINPTERFPYSANEWFKDIFARNGLEVLSFSRTEYENVAFKKFQGGMTVRFITATWVGTVRVTDAEKATNALRNGIGHAKCYGCGMLSVRKISE